MKTIYGTLLECALMTGDSLTIVPGTTLNEHLDSGNAYPSNTPIINYFSVGTWSRARYLEDAGSYKINRYTHRPTDIMPEYIVPFRMVSALEDLTVTESAEYRLRVVKVINGEPFVCYYLKKLSFDNTVILKVDNIEGEENLKIEQITSNIHTLADSVERGVDLTSQDVSYIGVTKTLKCVVTTTELIDMERYTNLVYPELTEPFLSEVSICSGSEETLSDSTKVASGVQPTYFLDVDIPIGDNDGKTFLFEIGETARESTEGV